MDFLTAEAWTPNGLETQHVLFAIELETRPVELAGITTPPDEASGGQWPAVGVARTPTLIGFALRSQVDGASRPAGPARRLRCTPRFLTEQGGTTFQPLQQSTSPSKSTSPLRRATN